MFFQSFVEVALSCDIKSIKPNPLGPIVVAEPLCNFYVSRIITIIVVWGIQGVVGLSQCGDSDRKLTYQLFLNNF